MKWVINIYVTKVKGERKMFAYPLIRKMPMNERFGDEELFLERSWNLTY